MRRVTRLYMADSGVCVLLSGLYMAPKLEYPEYGRCNSAPHTRDITIWVPYISHLAFSNCPNLPYVSQVAWCAGGFPRFRTGEGRFCLILGMGGGLVEEAVGEWGGSPWNRTGRG